MKLGEILMILVGCSLVSLVIAGLAADGSPSYRDVGTVLLLVGVIGVAGATRMSTNKQSQAASMLVATLIAMLVGMALREQTGHIDLPLGTVEAGE